MNTPHALPSEARLKAQKALSLMGVTRLLLTEEEKQFAEGRQS